MMKTIRRGDTVVRIARPPGTVLEATVPLTIALVLPSLWVVRARKARISRAAGSL
jgi:hypothetical protein